MTDMQRSIHGAYGFGMGANNEVIGRNYLSGYGFDQVEVAGSPARTAWYDDFTGASQAFSTTIIDGWRSRKGSDGACVDWTVTPAKEGSCVGTIGNTTASMAVSGVQLDRGLNYTPDQGGLVLQARVKMSVITNIAVFIGFTDQTAALEMPIQSAASADTFTTNATDAVGFMFDTSMANDFWWLTGVANDVDATMQNSALAPVAATYQTFRIELGATGTAQFFINGKTYGTIMASATRAAIPLTPVVAAFNRTTSGAPTVTVDYLNVAANRP
jgi:hypothetical protein